MRCAARVSPSLLRVVPRSVWVNERMITIISIRYFEISKGNREGYMSFLEPTLYVSGLNLSSENIFRQYSTARIMSRKIESVGM